MENKTYYSFEGIPYAKSPVGDLRFKDPVAAEAWSGVLNATGTTRVCPQLLFEKDNSEDCLLLNIYSKMVK